MRIFSSSQGSDLRRDPAGFPGPLVGRPSKVSAAPGSLVEARGRFPGGFLVVVPWWFPGGFLVEPTAKKYFYFLFDSCRSLVYLICMTRWLRVGNKKGVENDLEAKSLDLDRKIGCRVE